MLESESKSDLIERSTLNICYLFTKKFRSENFK